MPMDNFKIGVVCVHIWADVRKPTTMRKIRRMEVTMLMITVSPFKSFLGTIINRISKPTKDPFLTHRAEPKNVLQISRYFESSSLHGMEACTRRKTTWANTTADMTASMMITTKPKKLFTALSNFLTALFIAASFFGLLSCCLDLVDDIAELRVVFLINRLYSLDERSFVYFIYFHKAL